MMRYGFQFCKGGVFLNPESNKYDSYKHICIEEDEIYDNAISEFGFSNGVMMIIWTLCEFKRPCTQKEICDFWHESKQTINSAVKKLLEEGIIDIAVSPENQREKLITFTEKGKFLAMRTVEKMMDAEKNAFGRLSEEEQSEFIRINKKHNEFLKEEFVKIKGENK